MNAIPNDKNCSSNSVISKDKDLNISVYELTSQETEKNSSHLINELYSKGVTFSIKISKDKTHLIIYKFESNNQNQETKHNLINHLQLTYSLREIENIDDFFIPPIKKIDQDGKFPVLHYFDNSTNQYLLTCLLSNVNSEFQSISRKLSNFIKDLVQADIFSVILTQFGSRADINQRSNAWGVLFIARTTEKESIQKKEKTLQRYITASTEKLNCQLQFLSKKELIRYKTNFRLYVPWIKHYGVLNDIINLPKLLTSTIQNRRIVIPFPKTEESEEIPSQVFTPSHREIEVSFYQNRALRKKPYPSIRKAIEPEIVSKTQDSLKQFTPSNIDDLTIPTPRTMNAVFDKEYLKVRISKIFKEFEFKETLIFEENFDLVLRKETYYVFVKFFKDLLSQNNAYEIVENLSSIAGLRNQFLCIVVADVIEENANKLLNEYNILHITLTDVLVNDSLKAKLYGTILV